MTALGRVAVCARCKRDRPIKGRHLCKPCYDHLWWTGEYTSFALRHDADSPLVCVCAVPREERFWWPGAVQCGKCGRAIAKYLTGAS